MCVINHELKLYYICLLSCNYSTIIRYAKIDLHLSSRLSIAQQKRIKLPARRSLRRIIKGKVLPRMWQIKMAKRGYAWLNRAIVPATWRNQMINQSMLRNVQKHLPNTHIVATVQDNRRSVREKLNHANTSQSARQCSFSVKVRQLRVSRVIQGVR